MAGMTMAKDVEIDVVVRSETTLALKVSDGTREVWIPKSKISDQSEDKGRITSIFIPEWLATEKGLV